MAGVSNADKFDNRTIIILHFMISNKRILDSTFIHNSDHRVLRSFKAAILNP